MTYPTLSSRTFFDPNQYGKWSLFTAAITMCVSAILVDYMYMLYLRSKMPPGPFPLPIIGNTFLLPENKPWIYFEQVAKRYHTPIITFWIGRNPTVWLCDAWCASELLDKRAGLYSSRPRMVVFGELRGGNASLVSMRTRTPTERDRWRVHRKLMHLGVGIQQVRRYRDVQDNESKVVALDLLQDPEHYAGHLERYATSVVSIMAFGRRVASYLDPIITEVIAVMHLAADLNVPGKRFPMLLETFPVLAKFPRWLFPWLPWMKGLGSSAPRGKKGGHYFFYALAKEAFEESSHKDSFANRLFDEAPTYNLSAEEISSLTGNLFGAGADTSASTLITFILACCAFPESLPRAWEELDRVVGSQRSPEFEDEANLPYVKAFVKEVLRWRSVAIIGGQPHSPTQDDYYRGYLIPKDAWVQGNVWAIHRNAREFPEPDRFLPERFLENSPYQRPFPGEKGYMTFGWGRRVCSGQALAEQGTFISIARLLWGFQIKPMQDENGREIPVDIFAYTNGLNMRPKPFRCTITPRTDEIRDTIEREGGQALRDLAVYNGHTNYRMSTFYKA